MSEKLYQVHSGGHCLTLAWLTSDQAAQRLDGYRQAGFRDATLSEVTDESQVLPLMPEHGGYDPDFGAYEAYAEYWDYTEKE